jgi:threonine dehydrogenase-like Zn-dependent dehydrogenase
MAAERVRAMVLDGDRSLVLEEFARPAITADDALLRIEACGICGTDLEQYDGHMAQAGQVRYPFIPGHEPIGIIEEIGPAAAARWGVAAGDRVAVEPLIPCEECAACRAGQTTECSGWGRVYSYGMLDTAVSSGLVGGYAEHLHLHPRSVLHPVSAALPIEVAVMFNPMGAGVHWGVRAGDVAAGDTVVVLGAGQRGLTCLLAARAAGAGQVLITDLARAANKLELALELGADAVIVADEEDVVARVQELTEGRLADVVVDVSAMATQPVLDAVEMVRRGGTIVLAGLKGGRPVPGFVSDRLVFKSITMRGVFTVDSRAYVEAIRLIEAEPDRFARLHTRSYPLERAEEALLDLAGRLDGPPAVHVAIVP